MTHLVQDIPFVLHELHLLRTGQDLLLVQDLYGEEIVGLFPLGEADSAEGALREGGDDLEIVDLDSFEGLYASVEFDLAGLKGGVQVGVGEESD